jgi:peptidoglycan/LPS O-acetylase OafA/YrhL
VRYRPEIDGLRAIAVLSVLMFHAGLPPFSGGFAGVDVFFVISGYLITRNIADDLDSGTFSFRRFYLARLRRLYPALLATVAATLLIGALLFSPPHLAKLATSAIASLLTVSNIYFWNEVGYWDLEISLKPLLHIWSLSVEEQFYFVWPLLLFAAARLRHRRRAMAAVLAACGVASFGAATDFDQATVFYWMPLRAFEFAIGAGVIWLEATRAPRWVAELNAAAGIAAIGYAVFAFTGKTHFPAGALYPCIGAALLIYAGGSPVVARLWNNAPMIAIGRISYSLYLVHWPVVIFYAYWRIVPLGLGERFGLVAASFAFALPLHVLVERRYRYPGAGRTADNTAFLSSVAAVTCLVIALAGSAWRSDGWPWRHPSTKPFDQAMLERITQPCVGGVGLCPGPQKIVLIGDSHAGAIKIAVAETLQRVGLAGTVYPPATSCFLLSDLFPARYLADIRNNECRAAAKQWRARIEAEDPRIVILASFWIGGLDVTVSGPMVSDNTTVLPSPAESREMFERQMTETVDWLTSQGRKVIIIGTSPMVDQPPSVCYDRPSLFGTADCAKVNVLSKPETHAATTAFLKSLQRPDVLYVDLMAALCEDDRCPLGQNGVPFYYDRHHLNPYGELWLADRAFEPMISFLRKATAARH